MSQTFSTRDRDLSRGGLYSSRVTVTSVQRPPAAERPVTLAVLPPSADAPIVAPVVATPEEALPPAPPPAPEQRFAFALTPQSIVPAPPIGGNAYGTASLVGRPGEAYAVTAGISGLKPHRDPAIRPVLWLIHDLTVPTDLAPADLALLPKGVALTGNRPGGIFTVDGNPPTYGKGANTLSVAVTPGAFAQTGPDSWSLAGALDASTNVAFHPLAILGPSALANIDIALPSGSVAKVLTDLFMRPATVHPELPQRTHNAQRLSAIVQDLLTAPDPVAYLPADRFTRSAVTLEGIVRGTPRLMPTREACCLMGNHRT